MKAGVLLGVALAALGAVGASAAERAPSVGFAVGTASGTNARVKVFDGAGVILRDLRSPEPQAAGGVRVALGDITGDGTADVVTGAGPGGTARIDATDGASGNALFAFNAYDQFAGGVYVAAGDIDGDGRADIVTGAGASGAPNVKVFSGRDGSTLRSFFAFDPQFVGGVTVAAGDFASDGHDDLIVGAASGSSRVRVFDGLTNDVRFDFFAFDGFSGGVSLATGRYDGVEALIVGAGPGGAPQVKVFALSDFSLLDSFFAFDPTFTGGVNVGLGRVNGRDTLFAATATGGGTLVSYDVSPRRGNRGLRDFDSALVVNGTSQPFGPDYMGGLSVAGFAAAVPEPGVWLQLILGFGLAGSALRTRRTATA